MSPPARSAMCRSFCIMRISSLPSLSREGIYPGKPPAHTSPITATKGDRPARSCAAFVVVRSPMRCSLDHCVAGEFCVRRLLASNVIGIVARDRPENVPFLCSTPRLGLSRVFPSLDGCVRRCRAKADRTVNLCPKPRRLDTFRTRK